MQAGESLRLQFKLSTAGNFFDTHPPGKGFIFQIDGNFGTTAAIAEMLLQSHTGEIRLLPALPTDWHEGRVEGLCARGRVTAALRWKQDRLLRAELRFARAGTYRIRLRGQDGTPRSVLHNGTAVPAVLQDGCLQVTAAAPLHCVLLF